MRQVVVNVTLATRFSTPLRIGQQKRAISNTRCPANIFGELASRKLIKDVTSKNLRNVLSSPIKVYCGVDPTSDSIHVGNLLPLTCLLRFLQEGHSVIALIGGATGSIGDPSGRSSERNVISQETLTKNINGITNQINRFFDNGLKYSSKKTNRNHEEWRESVTFVNNHDWLGNMNILSFLGGPGRLSRVSAMLARESVKKRLDSDAGISFTEFTYQLLQAYDFWYLHNHHNCQLQVRNCFSRRISLYKLSF